MRNSLLLLATLTLLASCGKKDDPTPPTPTPAAAISIKGRVQLIDEFGNKQASSAGVLVAVTDISPQLTTLTAADGTYSLPATLTDGPHRISYTLANYNLFKAGPTTAKATQPLVIPDINLSPVSTTIITIRKVQQFGQKLVFVGDLTPTPTASQPRPHRLYFQPTDPNVPIKQPVEAYYDLTVAGTTRPDGSFSDTVKISAFQVVGMRYYDRVLVWAAGDNPAASTYQDPVSGILVYPAAIPKFSNYSVFTLYP